jgi:hypothetical protein
MAVNKTWHKYLAAAVNPFKALVFAYMAGAILVPAHLCNEHILQAH